MNENGWATGYQPEAIKPNIVEREGIYQLKVMSVKPGTIQPKDPSRETEKRYFQVECIINAPGQPKVSIFLTEGPNFNAHATAFFDTFSIQRGDFNSQNWVNHVGYMKIELKKKGEYTNMEPRYLLDANGFVTKPNMSAPQQAYSQPMQPSAPQGDMLGDIPF